MRCKLIILLPAYNEEANIGRLLDRISESMSACSLLYEVIVVDDGSRDRTPQILTQYAARMPLLVMRHEINLGLAAAIRDGLLTAVNRASDTDIIITMDADESHPPELIQRMVQLLREGRDVVIASRYRSTSCVHGLSMPRRLLSSTASLLFRILFPTAGIRDYTCGFRAYRSQALKTAFQRYGERLLDQEGFHCIADILLKLRRLPLVFGEVPLVLRYDLKRSTSKLRVARTVFQTALLLTKRRIGY